MQRTISSNYQVITTPWKKQFYYVSFLLINKTPTSHVIYDFRQHPPLDIAPFGVGSLWFQSHILVLCTCVIYDEHNTSTQHKSHINFLSFFLSFNKLPWSLHFFKNQKKKKKSKWRNTWGNLWHSSSESTRTLNTNTSTQNNTTQHKSNIYKQKPYRPFLYSIQSQCSVVAVVFSRRRRRRRRRTTTTASVIHSSIFFLKFPTFKRRKPIRYYSSY